MAISVVVATWIPNQIVHLATLGLQLSLSPSSSGASSAICLYAIVSDYCFTLLYVLHYSKSLRLV